MPKFNDGDKNNQISDTEKEQIRQYFLDNNIKEIRLEKRKLIITHNNNNNETKTFQQISHAPKLFEIMEFCQRENKNKITKESLGIGSDNNTNSEPNKDNHKLVIGLMVGVGSTILVGAIAYYFIRQKKNKEYI